MYMVSTMAVVMSLRSTYSRLLSAKESIEVSTTLSTVWIAVRATVMKKALKMISSEKSVS